MQNLNQNEIGYENSDVVISKKPIQVLHVDDDLCFLEVSKQILSTENNFDIDNAFSVDEALRKIEKHTYDAVVSDYEMPQKNGLDFLRELREKNNQISFILFTGKGREDVAVKALNLGSDSYLNKNGPPETVYCELAHAINKTVERKKSMQLLAASESKYRALVENSLQGLLILQSNPLRLAFGNAAMAKILGYSLDELMVFSQKEITELIYCEDRMAFWERLEKRFQGEKPDSRFEFRAVRKDGTIIWIEALSNWVEYDGKPVVQGMFLDITERKKDAQILLESERRYRELANSLPDIVFETDISGNIIFANERAPEISGYSLNEIEKGLNILQFVAPQDKEKATKNFQRLLGGGNYVPAEYTFVRKDGSTFPALIIATTCFCNNKVSGLRGLVLDITERKKADEIIKKNEARYREFANFLPEIVFEADLSGKITFFSQRAFEITGFTPEELEKGMNMLSFVVPEEREIAKENIKKSIIGEPHKNTEYTLLRKNGTTYTAIVKTAPIISENKVSGLRGIVIDITDHKIIEQKLLAASLYSRSLLEASLDPLVTISRDGKITDANLATEKVTGFPREELLGSDFSDYFTEPDNARAGYQKAFTEGLVKDYPLAIRHKTGRITPVLYNASIYKNQRGEIQVFAAARDITELKKAEELVKKNHSRICTMNEKLHVVGGLTRHDVGNKLMTIKANSYLLKKQFGDIPGLAEYLKNIDYVVDSCDKLFEFSRLYEKIGIEEPAKIDVEKCFDEAVELMPNLGNIKIFNDCHGVEVTADSLLRQFFYNLIENSLKHGQKVSQIRLSFIANDNEIDLFYEDDGVGIPEYDKPKIFNEGFTTGNGSGLGLKLIKKIAEVYNWKITEEGKPTEGVKFVITIPTTTKLENELRNFTSFNLVETIEQ